MHYHFIKVVLSMQYSDQNVDILAVGMNDFLTWLPLCKFWIRPSVQLCFIFPKNAERYKYLLNIRNSRENFLLNQPLAVWFEKACIGFVKIGFIAYHILLVRLSLLRDQWHWNPLKERKQEFVQETGGSRYWEWKCNEINLRVVQEIKAKLGKSGFSYKRSLLLVSFMH